MSECRAGFIGFGEINTPKEVVEGRYNEAIRLLEKSGIELVYKGTVTDDEAGVQAARASKELKRESFDFLIVCLIGWIPSHTVLEVIDQYRDKPVLLWGLAGSHIRGKLLTTAAQAGTTALFKPLKDMGFKVKFVYDVPDAEPKIEDILSFARAARAVSMLRCSKVGMMGCRDMRLYGTMFDGISLKSKIGTEVEFFEMLEVTQRMEDVKIDEINNLIEQIKREWTFQQEASDKTLELGSRIYIAIKKIIEARRFDAVSLIDVDGMKKLLKFPPAMVFMLIANELGKCTVPENDTLGSVTQLVAKYATGQIAAYMEFYEFMQDRVLLGVPDYIPEEVTDGPVTVIPASFGHIDGGILNVSKARTGKVTLARLGYNNGEYMMHIVTGEAVSPGAWEEVGWNEPAPQLPSLEVILDIPVCEFAKEVMSQHYIVTYGDNSSVFIDVCSLLGIRVI